LAIAFIAFSIGGSIVFQEIKKLGKGIIYITLFEAEVTFLVISAGLLILLPFIMPGNHSAWALTFIPLSLLLGCLGAPTDPSVALAIDHEYKAKGEVSSTILNVAAFDDVLGIINYSVAFVIAKTIISQTSFNFSSAFITPIFIIIGSVLLGTVLALIFNFITTRIVQESEGVFFVLILSFLTFCWGLATLVHAEQILSIMIMGIIIANYNKKPEKIFYMLERYSEELIFLIFFTLSAMHLDFNIKPIALVVLVLFIILRIMGKFAGTAIGANIADSSPSIKKYTASGLIPFGGIVVGLALMMQQDPAFSHISSFFVSTIIGATIINEFLGPIFLKKALKNAGEIRD
ncbi:MAG: cation:proton antiporter, partial [Candidatus Omnitrophica bacterium]|nr:cation:proton antiporter [Candidatus Omnitrophota bacterium]